MASKAFANKVTKPIEDISETTACKRETSMHANLNEKLQQQTRKCKATTDEKLKQQTTIHKYTWI